jgi:hypothetical protein
MRIDMFKGMSDSQICEIREVREKQIKESREIAEKRKSDEAAWDRYQVWSSRATLLLERERDRKKREEQQKLLEENRRLANNFKERYFV